MKVGKWILAVAVFTTIAACNNEVRKTDEVWQTPADLVEIDNVLRGFSPSAQSFSISGKKKSTITGARGTIIHIDPAKLETVDGSPLGNTIEISLLEIGEKVNMMLNNVTTTAGDDLLVSGGVFHIKMWSKGIELSLKEALDIELPTWVGEKAELFIGRVDSLGQTTWAHTNVSLVEKTAQTPEMPVNPEDSKSPEEINKQEYDTYLLAMQEYKRELEKIATAKNTYQTIGVSKLGWINAVQEVKSNTTGGSIQLAVEKQEGMKRARFYAVSKESKFVATANYREGGEEILTISNLPLGEGIVVIGVAIRHGQTMIFTQEVTSAQDLKLKVQFQQAGSEELRTAISMAG